MLNKNITATDLMKFLYCPRIPYYIYVLKIPQQITVKEEKGIDKYTRFKDKSKRNKIITEFEGGRKIYDVKLESEGYSTKADCVLLNGNDAYPIQIKYAAKPRRTYSTIRNQLLFEAFLIEAVFKKKVSRGFIKYLKSGDIVSEDLSKKDEMLKNIEVLESVIISERMPSPTKYGKRCVDCGYKKLCGR